MQDLPSLRRTRSVCAAAAAVDREDPALYGENAERTSTISAKSEPVKTELPLPPLFRRAGETA